MRFLSSLFAAAILGAGLGFFRFGHSGWQEWLGFSLILAALQWLIQAEIHVALDSFKSEVRAIADEAAFEAVENALADESI
jgi:hypothetical protein